MFISEKFYFNNIYCDDMGVMLVTFNDGIINDYGFSYSEEITSDNTYNNNPYYFEDKKNIEDIVLNICLTDESNNALTWDDMSLEEVCGWLITDGFKPFISEDNLDLVYYLKAKKISKKLTNDRKGYLEVTFQPYTSYAYKKYTKSIVVEKEKDIDVINYSNLNKRYRPIIEIENLGDELNLITIENTTIDSVEYFEIHGLLNGEKVIIDNLFYTVLNDEGDNRFSLCNRKWIELARGKNKLKICGNCKVTIKAEYPIIR